MSATSDVVQCPQCRTFMPADARFCPGCGEPRTALRQQLEQEAGRSKSRYERRLAEERLNDGMCVASGPYGSIVVTPAQVVMRPKGMRSKLYQGIKGDKQIDIHQISSVQFKSAGLFPGYIQFAFIGGREAKGGVADLSKDENAMMFKGGDEAAFRMAKDLIDRHRAAARTASIPSVAPTSALDELEKLAGMRDRGVVTEEEFQAKKRQLLDL